MGMEQIVAYIDENKDKYIHEVMDLVKIKSVSVDRSLKNDVNKCALMVADCLKNSGFKDVKLIENKGNPIVYGEMINDPSKPTFLVYGHYDVQPAVMSDGWNSDPFEPVVKNGFIYGRGVADDKGKMLIPIKAIEAFVKTNNKLPLNFKFFIEGNEEGEGQYTDEFVKNNKDLLSCDAVLFFDSAWILPNFPSITYSLKGLCYWQVDLKGPNRDVHSGIYGGKILNPLNVAAEMISKLVDDSGHIQIPGFYDDVVPLTKDERDEFASLPFKEENVLKDVDVAALGGEKGFSALERNWGRPTLDVCGIWGGYQGEGLKTAIPSEAHFKVSTRLVANQNAEKIEKSFIKYLHDICPAGIKITKIATFQASDPVMLPVDNKFIRAMAQAMEKGFGKKPALIRNGASIPIAATFKSVIGAPSLLFDLNVPDENIHGPNEKLELNAFHNGIKAAAYFYDLVSR